MGTTANRSWGRMRGLGARWVRRITASMASCAGPLGENVPQCPKKGNENGLGNLKSTHSCFRDLMPYFQHIPAVSVMAIGLPKLFCFPVAV